MAAPIPTEPSAPSGSQAVFRALPQAPADVPAAFAAAWATRRGEAIAALFTEDADFVNVTGLWWRGQEAIARPHSLALASFFRDTNLRPGRTEVRMLGQEHAVVRCRFQLTGQIAPDGTAAGPRQTIIVFVVQRSPEGWRAVTAQNTDVDPDQDTHVNTHGTLTPANYRR